MKGKFFAYFPASPEEFTKLWKDCFFVFDTSALLNLYEYATKASQDLIDKLAGQKLKNRIWIPHQVGLEFFFRRTKVISNQSKTYDDAGTDLRAMLTTFEAANSHPHIDPDLLKRFRDIVGEIGKELESRKSKLARKDDDPILRKLLDIFDGKVGNEYDDEKRTKIEKEGDVRNQKEIPPGFKDAAKTDNPYGDLIIWFQLIDEVNARKKPAILVTSDKKDDWWWSPSKNGPKIGPRPELIREIYDKTKQPFHIYSTDRFLEYSNQYLELGVQPETIHEVKAVDEAKAVDQAKTQYINLSGVIEGTRGASVGMFTRGAWPRELPRHVVLGRNLNQFMKTTRAAWLETKALHPTEAEPLQRILGEIARQLLPLAQGALGCELVHARGLLDCCAEIHGLANVKANPNADMQFADYVTQFGDGRLLTLEGIVKQIIVHLRGQFPYFPDVAFS